jgi:16S rRNA (uracil1498-N3)-methyltransferase
VVGRRGTTSVIVLVPPGTGAAEQLLELPPDEAHHLRVRRAEPGQHVELRDGAGLVGEAVLLESTARHALLRVTAARWVDAPEPLVLYVAAGDKDRFGWLVEKAAELGVTQLVPLETERTAGVSSRVNAAQLGRLRKRALDAIKQSGAVWAPAIAGITPFAAAVAGDSGGGSTTVRWLADDAGEWPPDIMPAAAAAVLIGPEGGFTSRERETAVAAGWRPVRLGGAVLRFETAAVAAAVSIGVARGRGANG